MDTKRTHALFIIGSDTLPKDSLDNILADISTRYGGCTLTQGTGYWSENGAMFGQHYTNLERENAYQIHVCTTVPDFDLEYLKDCFRHAAGYTNWIHCEVWETDGLHFQV